ncbi:MAG: hypothetical protein ABSB50_06395 [Terracidiphilus sp.]|jgi:hypothetical protein
MATLDFPFFSAKEIALASFVHLDFGLVFDRQHPRHSGPVTAAIM